MVSAVTLFEAKLVLMDDPPSARERLAQLLDASDATVLPFEPTDADGAFHAAHRFRKGRHPARLNLGDCAVCALAKRLGEPLLFVGDDFTHTDLESALTLPVSA